MLAALEQWADSELPASTLDRLAQRAAASLPLELPAAPRAA